MPLNADADDIDMSTDNVNSADASETMLGRLLKQSLNSAVEKAVGEAVEKALRKAVEEQVQNAIGRATQHVAETPIATIIKTEEPSEGPTVIDLTEDQNDEIKVEEDSSAILDDPIHPGRTYLIYNKLCCWRILRVDERLDVWSEPGSQAPMEDSSVIKPSSKFQWKCIEENGYFGFKNEATKSFLGVKYHTGIGSFLAATRHEQDYNIFRLERGQADSTYTLYYVNHKNTWKKMKAHGTDMTQCCIDGCVPAVDGCDIVYTWRFREVLEE